MSYATKEQLEELAAYMANQIKVPTIGVGGGYAPIGTIIQYMGVTAPQDYLICDGTVYNISAYPQLADFFAAQFGSKNYFGGDGTITFAVPDLRGEFLRGTGTNSHENQGSGATVGEHQDGTEIPNFSVYNRSSGRAVMSVEVKDPQAGTGTEVQKVDSAYTRSDRYYFVTAESSIVSAVQENRLMFTSRPTNTSVLYCIKAVVAGEVYSLEERVVGTWIDGKPIYQKSIMLSRAMDINNSGVVISELPTNIKQYVNAFANNITGGNCCALYLEPVNNKAYCAEGITANLITIQYTKTID